MPAPEAAERAGTEGLPPRSQAARLRSGPNEVAPSQLPGLSTGGFSPLGTKIRQRFLFGTFRAPVAGSRRFRAQRGSESEKRFG